MEGRETNDDDRVTLPESQPVSRIKHHAQSRTVKTPVNSSDPLDFARDFRT